MQLPSGRFLHYSCYSSSQVCSFSPPYFSINLSHDPSNNWYKKLGCEEIPVALQRESETWISPVSLQMPFLHILCKPLWMNPVIVGSWLIVHMLFILLPFTKNFVSSLWKKIFQIWLILFLPLGKKLTMSVSPWYTLKFQAC